MTALGQVIQAAVDSAGEFCKCVLDLDVHMKPAETGESGEGVQCVSVGLANEVVAMQIGLSADAEARELLTRTFLGFGPDEALDQRDVADALAEVANILAGGVKTRLNEEFPALKVGLPIWSILEPGIRQSRRVRMAEQPLCVGGNNVVLTILMEKQE